MTEFNFRYDKDTARKVAYVTFNKPEKLNAQRLVDYQELTRIMHSVNEDEDVKVVVFRGEGRAFGSGHDVSELGNIHDNVQGGRRPSQRKRIAVDRQHLYGRPGVYQQIFWSQKVTIAQCHGICFGTHLHITNCCDMAVASEDATFTHPGYRYIGPLGEIGPLIETIGLKRTKEMMLTGIPIDAQTAMKWGLVNKVVPLDQLESEIERLVEAVIRLPFDGICMGKANFEAAMDALGIGSSWNAGVIVHAMQTDIRYEPGEFNLFKARRDAGVTSAIRQREEHYKPEDK